MAKAPKARGRFVVFEGIDGSGTTTQAHRAGRRIPQLKRVGDDALYMTGFLRDNLRRRRLDIGYYRKLGATAYGVVHEGRAYPERWTFIIGVDGKILDVMTDVDAGSHGAQLAGRLEELGVNRR